MAKQQSTEEVLARLSELSRGPLTSEGSEFLIKVLSGANGFAAARAAQVIGRSGRASFVPRLTSAFAHFLDRPERDKGCWAKEAICQALDILGCLEPEVFLRGIRHVQMEPVYGGKADTAPNLRGMCGVALARMLYPDVHFELAPLLTDRELPARRAGVSTVASIGCERSELMLRMKVLAGDAEPEIIGTCFSALLSMEPKRSIPFVSEYLSSEDELIAGQAAAALGQSGIEDAFLVLRDRWEANTDLDFAKPLLLAIGLTRREEAFRLLLEVLADGGRNHALAALEALAINAADARRLETIRRAVESRRDSKISEAFAASYEK